MTTDSFDALRAALELPATFDAWRTGWEESRQTFDAESGRVFSPARIEESCRFLCMDSDTTAACLDALSLLEDNGAVARLAWHGHHLLSRTPPRGDGAVDAWPPPPECLGDATPMFYVIILLAGVPHVRELHRERGIPESITLDTLSDLELWMRAYHEDHGRFGLAGPGFLCRHFRGDLYKLGRLQFEWWRLQSKIWVYRHRSRPLKTVLAADGLRFRDDGQFDGANGVFDPDGAWTAAFHADDTCIHGHPITYQGQAQRQPITLPANEWECVLREGDPTLNVHIPATGPLDHDACIASYRQAERFFARLFPELQWKVFHCHSWLMDHQLATYLPETSNIVAFLRDWHLLPTPGASDFQTIERVFGRTVTDPFRAPVKTSLQRMVVEHMEKGGRWRNAAAIMFAEDLPPECQCPTP